MIRSPRTLTLCIIILWSGNPSAFCYHLAMAGYPGRTPVQRIAGGVFIAFALSTLLAYSTHISSELGDWRSQTVDVPIADSEWLAFYEDTASVCGSGGTMAPRCPALPTSPRLWESRLRRSDPGHQERVFARLNREYWIGTVIPPAT